MKKIQNISMKYEHENLKWNWNIVAFVFLFFFLIKTTTTIIIIIKNNNNNTKLKRTVVFKYKFENGKILWEKYGKCMGKYMLQINTTQRNIKKKNKNMNTCCL